LKKRIITASTHIGPQSHKEMKKEMGVFEKSVKPFPLQKLGFQPTERYRNVKRYKKK
jgi:hypothetical protein